MPALIGKVMVELMTAPTPSTIRNDQPVVLLVPFAQSMRLSPPTRKATRVAGIWMMNSTMPIRR